MCLRSPLHRGPERPVREAVNVRFQDVGDVSVIGYLPRKAANRVWKQPKRQKYIAVSKSERIWKAEQHFDIRHGDAQFGVCPAGFGLAFV